MRKKVRKFSVTYGMWVFQA